jgi:hypothetical protein
MGSHTQHRSPADVEQWTFYAQAAAEQIPQGYSRADDNARELNALSE